MPVDKSNMINGSGVNRQKRDFKMAPAPEPQWMTIVEAWRRRLGHAPWLPGTRLPSNTEIGREFGVSRSRAQQALALLASEGLLERIPGRGTIVTESAAPPAPLRRVGILLDDDARRLPHYQQLASLLCDALARRGIGAWMLPVDTLNPAAAQIVAKAVREGGVSALFLCPVDYRRYDEIKALRPSVPLLCNAALRRVYYAPDIDIYAKMAEALRRVGARRPAFAINLREEVVANAYAPGGTDDIPRKDAHNTWGAMFRLAMANAGFKIDPSRVLWAYPEKQASSAQEVGATAFATVRRLLAATPRPDALVVYTDDLVPGAVAAILESGLRVPRDLKCVFHCNTGMEPFVPFPCEWVVNDSVAEAELWAGRLDDLLSGRPLEPHLKDNLLPAPETGYCAP